MNVRACVQAFLVVAWLPLSASAAASPPDGQGLYTRHCERCHGVTGRGDGPDAELFATPPRDLRQDWLGRYAVDDLVRRVRSGVPLTLALDPAGLRAHAGDVEAIAAHLERLPKVDWRLVEEGQAVYLDRCELCHGPAGDPGPTVPSGARPPQNLGDPRWQKDIADAQLKTVVRHGRRGMPPLDPPIPADELAALVAFVRLLSPGYVLYETYCSACHGEDGRGAGSFAEEGRRPTVVFDRGYFQRRDPEQVRTAVWHMLASERPSMPHFRRRLDEREVRAVILYLKSAD